MHCPNCFATDLRGPRYGSVPGGYRRSAVMTCRNCRSVFDAYRLFGRDARAVRRASRRPLAA